MSEPTVRDLASACQILISQGMDDLPIGYVALDERDMMRMVVGLQSAFAVHMTPSQGEVIADKYRSAKLHGITFRRRVRSGKVRGT